VAGTDHSAQTGFALARYGITGTLDVTFGTGGLVTTTLPVGSLWGEAVALQPDGKIIVAGYGGEGSTATFNYVLARYDSNGMLDTGFGSQGMVTTTIGTDDRCYAVAVQPDGKIVVGGSGQVVTEATPTAASTPLSHRRYLPVILK